jgi:hypothetical protein
MLQNAQLKKQLRGIQTPDSLEQALKSKSEINMLEKEIDHLRD